MTPSPAVVQAAQCQIIKAASNACGDSYGGTQSCNGGNSKILMIVQRAGMSEALSTMVASATTATMEGYGVATTKDTSSKRNGHSTSVNDDTAPERTPLETQIIWQANCA